MILSFKTCIWKPVFENKIGTLKIIPKSQTYKEEYEGNKKILKTILLHKLRKKIEFKKWRVNYIYLRYKEELKKEKL